MCGGHARDLRDLPDRPGSSRPKCRPRTSTCLRRCRPFRQQRACRPGPGPTGRRMTPCQSAGKHRQSNHYIGGAPNAESNDVHHRGCDPGDCLRDGSRREHAVRWKPRRCAFDARRQHHEGRRDALTARFALPRRDRGRRAQAPDEPEPLFAAVCLGGGLGRLDGELRGLLAHDRLSISAMRSISLIHWSGLSTAAIRRAALELAP
jgi:hypothetical protein